jgi:hypothetical protein
MILAVAAGLLLVAMVGLEGFGTGGLAGESCKHCDEQAEQAQEQALDNMVAGAVIVAVFLGAGVVRRVVPRPRAS